MAKEAVKSKVFEYVIIHNPPRSKKEGSEEQPASLLTAGIQTILARDEKEAQIIVARKIPENFMARLEEVEIAIRPF